MELAHYDAFSAVDDERAVVGHQRNLAKEDLFFLDVTDRLLAGVLVGVPDGQADLDLQRDRKGHRLFLTLLLRVLMLKGHRLAAVVAQHRRHRVHRAALGTGLLFGRVRIDAENGAARTAVGTQVIQPFELSALALPIADRVLDKLKLRGLAKVGDRKHGPEHSLKPRVLAFRRKQIHLKEAVVRLALNLDEVRYPDRRFYARKIVPLSAYAVSSIR